jgi:hypothetical protein
MMRSESEGLGLSLLLYAAAIAGVLTAVALPVYIANAPRVYDNPPLANADPLLNGPIIGKRVSTRVPLARLHHKTIVDPAVIATLNANVEKPEPVHHTVRRTADRAARTPVAELQAEPKHATFFLFRLFGG